MKLRDVLSTAKLAAKLPEQLGDLDVTALTADSRNVKPGTVFFAMPGVKADGLSFAEQAAKAGAVVIVADRMPVVAPPIPVIVSDVSVGEIGRAHV